MAKKSARRNGGRTTDTKSQRHKRKRLQHFNFSAKLAKRVNIPGWNDKLTLKANYKKLGIAFDANAAMASPNDAFANPIAQLLPQKNGIMTDRLEYLQSLPKPTPREIKSMNVQEQYQLQRLIEAHQDNYTAMERDLKLNVTQSTARQLQKRIELMFRLQQASNDDADGEDEDDEGDVMDQLAAQMDELPMYEEDEDEMMDSEEEAAQNEYEQHLEKLRKQAQEQRKMKKHVQRIDMTKTWTKDAKPGVVVPKLTKLTIKGVQPRRPKQE